MCQKGVVFLLLSSKLRGNNKLHAFARFHHVRGSLNGYHVYGHCTGANTLTNIANLVTATKSDHE